MTAGEPVAITFGPAPQVGLRPEPHIIVSGLAIGTATLVAGTVTVADTAVTAASIIHLSLQSLSGATAPQALAVTARVPGVSFTITSADSVDTSEVGYALLG